MKKLTVSIGNLGSVTAGDYVDYAQGEPLRIESNAPVGCSVCVHTELGDGLLHSRDAAGVLNAVSTDIYKLIAKRFVFHHPNGEPVSATGRLGGDGKTLEQRVADLEERLTTKQQEASLCHEIENKIYSVSVNTKCTISYQQD